VGLSPLGTAATSGLLYKLQMLDEGDCGVIGGMKIHRGNQSTWRKPAPAPLCPPQIPHDQTRAQTRAAAVGSQRLTAWAMAQPTACFTACFTCVCTLYYIYIHTYILQGIYKSVYFMGDVRDFQR
jgi:hypothetical protein